MGLATRGNDALKIKVSSTETVHLAALGTVPGVVPLLAAAANGPGTAAIRSTSTSLSYRAPGSNTFGLPVDDTTDGTFVLHDGEDRSKWLRVQIYADHILPTRIQSDVFLIDTFNNDVSSDDVSSAEATAGDIETHSVTLENVSGDTLTQITFWLDSLTKNIEISDDNVTFVAPTTKATGLQFAGLTPGATATLYIKRTITAGAESDPNILTHIHSFFCGHAG